MDALIGNTGFIGSTLLRQRSFDRGFCSNDISKIRGGEYRTVVCAGAPAAKWIADRDPAADLANIQGLASNLAEITVEQFILVSTVDVFAWSAGVDEDSPIEEAEVTPYGRNRIWLERFIRERFPSALIVRLPGVVGPGLRKNPVFDFLNENNLQLIDARAFYQFYPVVNLWSDLEIACAAGITLLHLTSEPMSLAEVAKQGFGIAFNNRVVRRSPANYDFQTKHATAFGSSGRYTCMRRESLLAIRTYAQSEPRSKPLA